MSACLPLGATCTGIGDVVLVNQSLARTAALRVVGSRGVIVEPLNGAPGIEKVANAECTITGGGFSPETIERSTSLSASPRS
jgi:hypothetical protein